MSWAARRRFLIFSVLIAFVLFILALIFIATFTKAPSCSDGKQNQGEQGIDCGSPCTFLCTELEQPAVIRFTRALPTAGNRVDILSYVDNSNQDAAARQVPYSVTLYGSDHTILRRGNGYVDLPAGTSVPIFLPNFYTGQPSGVLTASLSIDAGNVKWFTARPQRVGVTVGNPQLGGTQDAPRVSVTLTNPNATQVSGVTVIASIFNAEGNVIAASETLIPLVPANDNVTATFTWSVPFTDTPAKIEIIPLQNRL